MVQNKRKLNSNKRRLNRDETIVLPGEYQTRVATAFLGNGPGYGLPQLPPARIPGAPPNQGQLATVPPGTKQVSGAKPRHLGRPIEQAVQGVTGAIAAGKAVYEVGKQINEATGGKAGELGNKALKAVAEKGKGMIGRVQTGQSTTPPNAIGPTSTKSSSTSSKSTTPPPAGKLTGAINNNGGKSYLMACDKPLNKRLDISTGVRSGLISNEAEPMSLIDYSPLFLMGGNILKQDAFNTDAQNYIRQVIYPMINVNLQSRINYDFTLTDAQMDTWFSTITKALQFYYFIESIIVYCSDKNNTNMGIRFMRTKITSQMLLKHNLIRDLLGKSAIPPRIVELFRYLNQNFTFSEVPGSPLYKIMMGNLFNSQATKAGDDAYKHGLQEAIFDSIIASFSVNSAVLNKVYVACPEWRIKGQCLPPMTLYPTIDRGFQTFWFNASLTYSNDGITTQYTRSAGEGGTFRYWMSTNELDGLWYAMSVFRNTSDTAAGTRPGIFDPVTTFGTDIIDSSTPRARSNIFYYEQGADGANRAIYAICRPGSTAFAGLALQAGNICVPTYDFTVSPNTFVPYYNNDGTFQVAQECTFNTWKECVYNVIKWVFD